MHENLTFRFTFSRNDISHCSSSICFCVLNNVYRFIAAGREIVFTPVFRIRYCNAILMKRKREKETKIEGTQLHCHFDSNSPMCLRYSFLLYRIYLLFFDSIALVAVSTTAFAPSFLLLWPSNPILALTVFMCMYVCLFAAHCDSSLVVLSLLMKEKNLKTNYR